MRYKYGSELILKDKIPETLMAQCDVIPSITTNTVKVCLLIRYQQQSGRTYAQAKSQYVGIVIICYEKTYVGNAHTVIIVLI